MTASTPVDAKLAAALRPGESTIADGVAGYQTPRSGYLSFAAIAALIEVWYLVADRVRSKRIDASSEASGFPLARHMRLTLTTQRLLVWRASWAGRRRALIGAYPIENLVSVRCPYSSTPQGRTTVFTWRSGLRVQFTVETSLATFLDTTWRERRQT